MNRELLDATGYSMGALDLAERLIKKLQGYFRSLAKIVSKGKAIPIIQLRVVLPGQFQIKVHLVVL